MKGLVEVTIPCLRLCHWNTNGIIRVAYTLTETIPVHTKLYWITEPHKPEQIQCDGVKHISVGVYCPCTTSPCSQAQTERLQAFPSLSGSQEGAGQNFHHHGVPAVSGLSRPPLTLTITLSTPSLTPKDLIMTQAGRISNTPHLLGTR